MSVNTIELLVEEGWRRSRDLHRFLSSAPDSPTKSWDPRILFLACLSMSVQSGKFTGMERDDFLNLCGALYDNINVGPSIDPTIPRKEEKT